MSVRIEWFSAKHTVARVETDLGDDDPALVLSADEAVAIYGTKAEVLQLLAYAKAAVVRNWPEENSENA